MLGDQCKGALFDKVCRLVECVKRYTGLEDAESRSAGILKGVDCICALRAGTDGGGGGDDSRRRSRGLGVPLGSDAFLCARNWIEGRRTSSCAIFAPFGRGSGLPSGLAGSAGDFGAGDACRPSLDVGDALIVVLA